MQKSTKPKWAFHFVYRGVAQLQVWNTLKMTSGMCLEVTKKLSEKNLVEIWPNIFTASLRWPRLFREQGCHLPHKKKMKCNLAKKHFICGSLGQWQPWAPQGCNEKTENGGKKSLSEEQNKKNWQCKTSHDDVKKPLPVAVNKRYVTSSRGMYANCLTFVKYCLDWSASNSRPRV